MPWWLAGMPPKTDKSKRQVCRSALHLHFAACICALSGDHIVSVHYHVITMYPFILLLLACALSGDHIVSVHYQVITLYPFILLLLTCALSGDHIVSIHITAAGLCTIRWSHCIHSYYSCWLVHYHVITMYPFIVLLLACALSGDHIVSIHEYEYKKSYSLVCHLFCYCL